MSKSIRPVLFAFLVVGVIGLAVPAQAAPSGSPVTNQAELEAALAVCDGTPNSSAAHIDGSGISVSANLTVPAACTNGFTLDLNGKELTGKSLIVAAGGKLIITDTSPGGLGELTMSSEDNGFAGIHVPKNSTLIINQGLVEATGDPDATAGIGTAPSGDVGIITINGGTVNATGGYAAAGIGGGQNRGNSVITITGGTVSATGGYGAAGIGAGETAAAESITITGGTVTAQGGQDGAGIGGGYDADAESTITISGGTVTTTGGNNASGIGAGAYDAGADVAISGGTITATGGNFAAGIGGGRQGADSEGTYGTITISSGTTTAQGGTEGAGIGGGLNDAGGDITIAGGTVTATGGPRAAGIGSGDSAAGDEGQNITISGGTVNAQGGVDAAGIGGSLETSGNNITISGGTVTATGGDSGAGIGGGRGSDERPSGGSIAIQGGIVTAEGGDDGAGIGGGEGGDGGEITISAGTVTALGTSYATAIGGGFEGNGADLTIGAEAVVTLRNGFTLIGAGDEADEFGEVLLAGELRLPSGRLRIPDSIDGQPEITITESGQLLGDVAGGDPTGGAELRGRGQIHNDGVIGLRPENVINDDNEISVSGNFYIVTFDTNGGLGGVEDPITVFAPSFISSYREYPDNPTLDGFEFAGWGVSSPQGFRLGAAEISEGWTLSEVTSIRENAGPNEGIGSNGMPLLAVAQWIIPTDEIPTDEASGGQGEIPDTGAPLPFWLAAIALIGIASGAVAFRFGKAHI